MPRITTRNATSAYLERMSTRNLPQLWFGPRDTVRSLWRGIWTRDYYLDRGEESLSTWLNWAEGVELMKRDRRNASAA
jgi:hypothetical protein